MGDFALPGMNNSFGFAPSQVNFIEPGKRPMSSMSPMILYDRESRKVHRVKFLFCREGFPFFASWRGAKYNTVNHYVLT
jgi:hypothetical protein